MKMATLEFMSRTAMSRRKPAVSIQHHDGTASFTWYVDDDAERYVELRDSARSDDFMILYRNHAIAKVVVVCGHNVVEEALREYLRQLEGNEIEEDAS